MREVSLEEWKSVHQCHRFLNETMDRYYVIDRCALCPEHVPIVEKIEGRMKEYADWLWNSMSNPDLPRLAWDKSTYQKKIPSYGDLKTVYDKLPK